MIFNTQFDESSPSASFSVQDKINYEEEKQIEEDEDEFKMPEESKVG